MIFEKTERNSITVVSVNLKKATIENTEKFRAFLMEIIDQGVEKIVVDLSSCEYVDSTFLGTLVVLLKAMDCAGCSLRLVCNEKVKFIICEITHLSSVFRVFATVEEAISDFENE